MGHLIVSDPSQANNLAGKYPDLQQRFKDRVLKSRRPSEEAQRPYDDEPIPSTAPSNTQPGVRWAFYAGNFPWVPSVTGMPGKTSGSVAHWNDDFKISEEPGVIVYDGYLTVPRTGEYTMTFQSGTKSIMRLHQALLFDSDKGHDAANPITTTVHPEQGEHPFTLSCLCTASYNPKIDIQWKGPAKKRTAISAQELSH